LAHTESGWIVMPLEYDVDQTQFTNRCGRFYPEEYA
jgi:hypothetical protein